MTKVHSIFRFRCSLKTILILFFATALFIRLVIAPEYRRAEIVRVLENRHVIRAPIVTMFGGRQPGSEPIPEPAWFSTRQHLARICGVPTVPWYGPRILAVRADEAKSSLALLNLCDDLRMFVARDGVGVYSESPDSPNISFPLACDTDVNE